MPISKKEFEGGKIDPREIHVEQRVLSFLRAHPEDAFDLPEIQEGISYGLTGITDSESQTVRPKRATDSLFNTIVGGLASVALLTLILSDLTAKGTVSMRIIEGTRYYMIR